MSRDFIGGTEPETRVPLTSEPLPSNILTDEKEAQLRNQTLDCEKNYYSNNHIGKDNSKDQKGPKMFSIEISRKDFHSLSSIDDNEYTSND